MLARRKDKLPFYLHTLQEMEYTEKYPGFILNNFHSLLRFWQQHYLNKDKDSTCLENVCVRSPTALGENHGSLSGPACTNGEMRSFEGSKEMELPKVLL